MQVTKRAGQTELFQVSKIRKVIDWCCENLDVNSLELEASFTERLYDGIKTSEIQGHLVESAKQLCSYTDPEWRYVAGRLLIWGYTQQTKIDRGYGYGDYLRWVKESLSNRNYDCRIAYYKDEDLIEAGSWINPELDRDYDLAGGKLLTTRYLLHNELPQEAYLTCALLLALPETPSNRLKFAKDVYNALSQRKISLATPILANLRIPDGSLTSCFIISMEDNLESIFREITNTARISKQGGGVGVNISSIRATGSTLKKKENGSGGVLPWMSILNQVALAVNQNGKRSGAVTISLDSWHYDLLEFLECQTESGDLRRKAFDVFPQIVASDVFMEAVVNNDDWYLVDPYEVKMKLGYHLPQLWGETFRVAYGQVVDAIKAGGIKLYQKVSAKNLFKKIMKTQVETGLPYIAFKDTINKANPNKFDGYIPSVNLCVESFSNVQSAKYAHCCNLVSINLANVSEHEYEYICSTSVRLLDNTIELTNPPFGDAENHNNRYRTIGVGFMGLADYLSKNFKTYKDLDVLNKLFDTLSYHCVKASALLAKERGAFDAFAISEWSKDKLINSNRIDWYKEHSHQPERWEKLAKFIKLYGIRNSHIMAIAPNTSSSLIHGCTASVLPPFKKFHYDKAKEGSNPVAPPFINKYPMGYVENTVLDQNIVVDAISTIQQWIDTGISMELVFNLNEGVYHEGSIKAEEIYNVLIKAWHQNCKAVYYVRCVQKDDFKENSCVSCAN